MKCTDKSIRSARSSNADVQYNRGHESGSNQLGHELAIMFEFKDQYFFLILCVTSSRLDLTGKTCNNELRDGYTLTHESIKFSFNLTSVPGNQV